MERRILVAAAVGGLFMAASAVSAAPPRAVGTSVQLPTFNFFTVATTVEVPDSGAGFLGGVGSGASGSSQHGIPGLGFRPFNNAATGVARGAGGMSIRAEIQDLDAMDKAILDGAGQTADNNSPDAIAIRKLPVMLRPVAADKPRVAPALTVDSAGGESLADIRRQQAAADAAADAEAQRLFAQASDLQAAGKPEVAKIYYRMAARRATGSLRDQAIAALRDLSKPAAYSAGAVQEPR